MMLEHQLNKAHKAILAEKKAESLKRRVKELEQRADHLYAVEVSIKVADAQLLVNAEARADDPRVQGGGGSADGSGGGSGGDVSPSPLALTRVPTAAQASDLSGADDDVEGPSLEMMDLETGVPTANPTSNAGRPHGLMRQDSGGAPAAVWKVDLGGGHLVALHKAVQVTLERSYLSEEPCEYWAEGARYEVDWSRWEQVNAETRRRRRIVRTSAAGTEWSSALPADVSKQDAILLIR